MKKFPALLLVLGAASFLAAAEPAKPPAEAKTKGPSRADLEICCDDDTKPADAKDTKAAEPKADAAKKEAAKPAAKK